MRFSSYGAAGVLTMCLMSAPALANRNGMTGVSGKNAAQTCTTTCHSGGTAPTVELTGPTTLAAGETGQFALTIRGGAAVVGGMNVAVSNTRASLEPGAGQRKSGSEITHSAPKAFTGGEVRFDFAMVAPSAGGTVTLYGAGNSANGNDSETGDLSAMDTHVVTVTGGTGGETGAPDAGTGGEPGSGDGDGDGKAGCSATGGSPLLLLSLLAAGRALPRRRRE
jgi:hypothetical protein